MGEHEPFVRFGQGSQGFYIVIPGKRTRFFKRWPQLLKFSKQKGYFDKMQPEYRSRPNFDYQDMWG